MSTKIMTISPSLAKDYDATSTYEVGEYVLRQNAYWKCTTAITDPEPWNTSHWEIDEEPLENVHKEFEGVPDIVDSRLNTENSTFVTAVLDTVDKLPEDLVEVEYVEFDGTQYVDLGFKANTVNTRADVKISSTYKANTTIGLLGSRNDSTATSSSCNVLLLGNKIRVDWYSGKSVNSVSIAHGTQTTYSITRGEFKINGEDASSGLTPPDESAMTPEGQDNNFLLGTFSTPITSSVPDGIYANKYIGKWYWTKIYQSGRLFMDLVPVARKDEHEIGYFYDKKSGTLFGSEVQDHPLIAGPVKTEDILQVDASLTQQGAAADAKAVGDALRSGFTPWEFSGNVSPGVTYTVDIVEYDGPTYIASLDGSDGTGETNGVDSLEVVSASFPVAGITATRHLITPTKTSQLTNDGAPAGNGSPYITEQSIPYSFNTVEPTVEAGVATGIIMNRAINIVSNSSDIILTLPAAIKDKVRDFIIKVIGDDSHQITISNIATDNTSVIIFNELTLNNGAILRFTEVAQEISNGSVVSASFKVTNLNAVSGNADHSFNIVTLTPSENWFFEGLPPGSTATTSFHILTDQDDEPIGGSWYLYLNGSEQEATSTPVTGPVQYTENSLYIVYGAYTENGVVYNITAKRIFDLRDRASNIVSASTNIAVRCPGEITGKSREFIVNPSITTDGAITILDEDANGNSVTFLEPITFDGGEILKFVEVAQGVFHVNQATVPTKTSDIENTGQPSGAAEPTGAQYALVNQIPTASTTTPTENGIAAIGELDTSYAKADHVHPHDTTKLSVDDVYDDWDSNKSYNEGDIIKYEGTVYKATQFIEVHTPNPSVNNKWSAQSIPKIQTQINKKYTYPSTGIPWADLEDYTQTLITGKLDKTRIKRLTDNSITEYDVLAGNDVKEALELKSIDKRDLTDLGVLGSPVDGKSWFIVYVYDTNNNVHEYRLDYSNNAWTCSLSESSSSSSYATYITITKASEPGVYELKRTGYGTLHSFQLDNLFSAKFSHVTGTYYIKSLSDTIAKTSDLESLQPRYEIYKPSITSKNGIYTCTLKDRASNIISTSEDVSLIFPEVIADKVRDFIVKIEITGDHSVTIQEVDHTGVLVGIDPEVPEMKNGTKLRFTELKQTKSGGAIVSAVFGASTIGTVSTSSISDDDGNVIRADRSVIRTMEVDSPSGWRVTYNVMYDGSNTTNKDVFVETSDKTNITYTPTIDDAYHGRDSIKFTLDGENLINEQGSWWTLTTYYLSCDYVLAGSSGSSWTSGSSSSGGRTFRWVICGEPTDVYMSGYVEDVNTITFNTTIPSLIFGGGCKPPGLQGDTNLQIKFEWGSQQTSKIEIEDELALKSDIVPVDNDKITDGTHTIDAEGNVYTTNSGTTTKVGELALKSDIVTVDADKITDGTNIIEADGKVYENVATYSQTWTFENSDYTYTQPVYIDGSWFCDADGHTIVAIGDTTEDATELVFHDSTPIDYDNPVPDVRAYRQYLGVVKTLVGNILIDSKKDEFLKYYRKLSDFGVRGQPTYSNGVMTGWFTINGVRLDADSQSIYGPVWVYNEEFRVSTENELFVYDENTGELIFNSYLPQSFSDNYECTLKNNTTGTEYKIIGYIDTIVKTSELPKIDQHLSTTGAAADAKAVGDALRNGFTEWVFSNSSIDVNLRWTGTLWEIQGIGACDPPECYDFYATSLTSQDQGFTATRHLITPTKTSQLTNDGAPNGGTPYATTAQVAAKQDALSAAQLANIAAVPNKANTSDVNAALAQKASLADLPYRLVTPGEWEFGSEGSYTMDGPHEALPGEPGTPYFWKLYLGAVWVDDSVSYESPYVLSVEFPIAQITATRASLPGHLLDRAVNKVSVTDAITLTLPEKIDGKSRDFLVYATISNSAVPTFVANGNERVSYLTDDGTFHEPDSDGIWSYSFTEMTQGVFAVSLIKLIQVNDGTSSSSSSSPVGA